MVSWDLIGLICVLFFHKLVDLFVNAVRRWITLWATCMFSYTGAEVKVSDTLKGVCCEFVNVSQTGVLGKNW